MPSFIYKAKDAAARTVTNRISAGNQEEAMEMLIAQGLVPVSIEEANSEGVLVSNIRASRIKPKELYLFTKQLGGLIKSGVALLKALEVIAAQTKNRYFAKVLGDTAIGVKTGRAFSSCLSDYPDVFSALYVAMIRVGEEMGHLKEVLADIADFQKRQDEMSSKVTSAMVYPLVMLSVGAGAIFFILTFVLPKISAIFAATGEQLPLPTLIVMKVSHFFREHWIILGVTVLLLLVLFNRWRKSSIGKIMMGYWLLKIPYIRELVLKADIARFSRTVYLLLDSGLSLVRSIEVSAPTIYNPQLRVDMLQCAQGLNAGENLAGCLRKSQYLPEIFTQILSIAEESGALNDALKDIAESCESDVNEAVKVMTTLIEPMMILGVGLVVGFIVFAMLLPIFSMDIMAR